MEDFEDYSKFAVQLGLGFGYQITDDIDIDLRYSLGLTGYSQDGEEDGYKWEETATPNSLTIGLNYKFN